MTKGYTRIIRHRPVRRGPPRFGTDIQQALPLGWCPICGMEVYRPGRHLCPSCEEVTYETKYDPHLSL